MRRNKNTLTHRQVRKIVKKAFREELKDPVPNSPFPTRWWPPVDTMICPCGGTGLLRGAPVHTAHGLSYVAWSAAVVIDCPWCTR